jgi:hypothetical protein
MLLLNSGTVVSYCVLQVVLPLDAPKVLMLELAEEVAANVLVHHVPGIQAVSRSLLPH